MPDLYASILNNKIRTIVCGHYFLKPLLGKLSDTVFVRTSSDYVISFLSNSASLNLRPIKTGSQ